MGVVYKAMDRRLAEAGSKDHWVAIKVLSPQLAENGQALRALQQEFWIPKTLRLSITQPLFELSVK